MGLLGMELLVPYCAPLLEMLSYQLRSNIGTEPE